jgi:hypothetical protein
MNIRKIIREELEIEFINERLEWSTIKNQIMKAIKPINGDINQIKKVIVKFLKKGVLPIIILISLSHFFSEKESNSILKEVIKEYDDGYDIINNEIEQAKSIVFRKINNYKNKEQIIKRLDDIDIVISDINNNPSFNGEDLVTAANFLLDENSKDVCIVVDINFILTAHKQSLIETISHEMLHYVDYLIGGWSIKNEDIINNSIDSKIFNEDYAASKLFKIIFNEDYNYLFDKSKNDTKKLNKLQNIHQNLKRAVKEDMLNNINYYSSPKEMYVRVNLLRNFMKSKGVISKIDDKLKPEHFDEVIKIINISGYGGIDNASKKIPMVSDYVRLLFLLDFNSNSINKIVYHKFYGDKNMS